MLELTGKQKRHLRGIGQGLGVLASVGKAGIGEPFVAAVRELLDRQELVKIRLPAGPGKWRNALAGQIAEAAGAVCAGVVGRTALLYRPNESLDTKGRIHFP